MYEVELVRPEIENREPIIAGSFILKNAKQRRLELDFNFFEKLCDADNFEELEMDTDSLYFTLWEENFEGLILSQKPVEGNAFERFHRKIHFQRNRHFFRGMCFNRHKKHDKREQGYSSKILDVQQCCFSVVKRIVAVTERVISTNSASKVWTNGL